MVGPISATSAARRMCERSGWTLTNLHLQKMLYLAQMIYMGEHAGERLMSETFQAWDFGPVSPTVYVQAKTFGRGPVRDVFRLFANREIDASRSTVLDKVYDQLATRTAGQLVALTHWKDGAWAACYRAGSRGIPIPDSEILNEYRKRAKLQTS